MRAKKYGGMACLRNACVRRHLFYNQQTALSLDEILEYANCRCIGKWWEVTKIGVSANKLRLERTCVLKTEVYQRAWDAVKDPDHELKVR